MRIKSFTNQNPTGAIGSRFKFFTGILVFLSLLGCVSNQDHEIELATSAYQDLQYHDVYTKHTNNYEVIKNFETRYKIHATLLSGEFRQALASRYQKIFLRTKPSLVRFPIRQVSLLPYTLPMTNRKISAIKDFGMYS